MSRKLNMSQAEYNLLKINESLELIKVEERIVELEERFKGETSYALELLSAINQGHYVNESLDSLVAKKEELVLQNENVLSLAREYFNIAGEISKNFEGYKLIERLVFDKLDKEIDSQISGEYEK